MKNMRNNLLLLLAICLLIPAFAQEKSKFSLRELKDKEMYIRKSGIYLGYQKGRYDYLEFGFERQLKHVKLIKPVTHSFSVGTSFNFLQHALGFELGYYNKTGRANFTYGVKALYYTDIIHHRMGISPTIGYKLYGFHLQAGVNLLTLNQNFHEVNGLYLSLRFFLMKHRNVKVKD